MAPPLDEHLSDDQVADALDGLARHVNALRRMLPQLTLEQLAVIAGACPFPGDAGDALLELDTWAIAAASALRREIVDLAG